MRAGVVDCPHSTPNSQLHTITRINAIRAQPHARTQARTGELDVDGEVRVRKAHAVAVALGDADDHVLNVGGHRADGGELQAVAEPHVEADGALAQGHSRDGDVLEGAGQGAAGARHRHVTGLDLHGDCACGEGRRTGQNTNQGEGQERNTIFTRH